MKKIIIFTIIVLTSFSIGLVAQENTTQETHQVVTAESVKTVDAKDANNELYDKLHKKRKENEEEYQRKSDNKRMIKLAGKILVGVVCIGAVAYWRSRKKTK